MQNINIQALCTYAKQFSGLDEEKIIILQKAYEDVKLQLQEVTNRFYARLIIIPKIQPYLIDRIEVLKKTHVSWLHELFTSDFGDEYTQHMYKVGYVHVQVKLPIEFMTGAMIILQEELMEEFSKVYRNEPLKLFKVNRAIASATGFSSLVMQESYQASTLAEELEKFLRITGMSRKLFNNLARAYQ